ncbi:TadE/TadG family type IV pilus assembly protein [Ponticaulis koreensis]|uniref:TadE/TadG family type IV pilus assembly protein n=1 Tax=Ponticaulis koreensis TaxID=1123045 RepID=UPI0003B6E4EF|nr:TadE/TadG family type IV pilus assembly protein [Ponticaulis koreensis]
MRHFIYDKKGASAVEFALVAPVLMFILAAIVGYGMVFLTAISLQQLGADVTRATIGGFSASEKQELAAEHLAVARREYVLIDNNQVAVDVTYDADTETTVVEINYDITGHPVELFSGLIPMPANTFTVRQSISERTT